MGRRTCFLALACCWMLALHTRALAQSDSAGSLTSGGRQRTYWVHVPPAAVIRGPLPLVLVLHGGGGTGVEMADLTAHGFERLSDRDGFLVVYPDGVNKGWNDGRKLQQLENNSAGIDDVLFFSDLIEHLAGRYSVDRRRVYACGISNGGFMSHRLATDLGDKIAAIGPVASGISVELALTARPRRPVSVMMIQGTADPLVPFDGGMVSVLGIPRGLTLSCAQTTAYWCVVDSAYLPPAYFVFPDLAPDRCRATAEVHLGGREGTEVTRIVVAGGGHTWPGGQQYLPASTVGVVCRDFNASNELWRFFQRHYR
jgi:polyhydroxybutyrate depolymerase